MTTATITASRSTYTTAPHHIHLSADSSTFDSGGLEDAQIEWWCQDASDDSVFDSVMGVPGFGVLIDVPGDYIATLRVKGAGDSEWSEDTYEFTVGTPSYAATCYVDMGSLTDGAGTIGDPFNSWATAFTYIRTNWVTGATSEHSIYAKRGTTGSTTANFDADASELQGRLVIQTYDSGAKPDITYTGATGEWIRSGDECAIALIDLSFDGDDDAWFCRKDNRGDEGPDGYNIILLRCDLDNTAIFNGVVDNGFADPAVWSAGAFDFIAVKGCTATGTSAALNGYGLVSAVRYGLYQDNQIDVYPTGGSIGIRFLSWQHLCLRGNHHEAVTTGSPLRLHAANSGVESLWLSFSDSWINTEDIWIACDDGNTVISPMRHVWCVRVTVNAPTQVRAIAIFATERLVMRNCWTRGACPMITSRSDAASLGAYSNWIIENNSHTYDGNANPANCGLSLLGTPTDITFRNNIVDAPSQTSNGLTMLNIATGTPAPATVLTACDGNQFNTASGTVSWAAGFSTGNGNLATWQAATTFDDNSNADGVMDFVAGTGSGDALDLRIGASSTAIGAGVATTGVYTDYDGFLMDDDAGSVERGATLTPTAPSNLGPIDPNPPGYSVSEDGMTTFSERRRQRIARPFRKGPGPKWASSA